MKATVGTQATALAILLCLFTVGNGFAADLPAGPPPPAHVSYHPYTQYDWSGFYIGLNGGYGFGSSNWAPVITEHFKTSGALAGGTVGINYQGGPFVVGFEADADWAGFKGSSSTAAYCMALGVTCETKQDWLVTARARVGYAFSRLLIFGTAGGATGEIRAGLNPPGKFDTTNSFGWTAGGGLEAGITENWTAKVEYLYVDLGNGSCTSTNCGPLTPITIPLTESLVRAGINYRFSW
jgi:outer membrane immunogenic protein